MSAARRVLRWLLPWLLLIGLAAVGIYAFQRYQARQAAAEAAAAAEAIRSEAIARGDLVARVSATGVIQAEEQVSLFFALPGTVAEVLVESGQAVAAGQALARLDPVDLAAAVQQARDSLTIAELNRAKLLAGPDQADVLVAEASLRSARTRLADLGGGTGGGEAAIAQLKHDNLLADYQRLADQYNNTVQFAADNPRFAPPADVLDQLKANMESAYYVAEIARLQLVSAQKGAGPAQTAVAQAQVVQAQAVLSQTLAGPTSAQLAQADLAVEQAATAVQRAQMRLAQADLTAPFAGVVAEVAAKPGEPAPATRPAVVLLDVSTFVLLIQVDEVDMARLALGQPVSVTVDALPATSLAGAVDRLAPTATVSGGLVNYAVHLKLAPTEGPLRAGMSATADVVVAEARDVVLVPNWAIRRDRRTGQAYASLLRDGVPTEVVITTGLRGDDYTEVTSGATTGDVAAVSTARQGLPFPGGE